MNWANLVRQSLRIGKHHSDLDMVLNDNVGIAMYPTVSLCIVAGLVTAEMEPFSMPDNDDAF